jgi:hypothetical protein
MQYVLCEVETDFLISFTLIFVFKRLKIQAYMIWWKCAKIKTKLNYAYESANEEKCLMLSLTDNVGYHPTRKAVAITTALLPINKVINL